MITVYDIQERSLNGPVLRVKEFDLKYSKKVREMVKYYDVVFNREELIPDDKMADKVFNAGFNLLLELGIYNTDTNRVIEFTRKEIEEMIHTTSREYTIGEGQDMITIREREPDEERPPIITPGPAGTVLSEDLFVPIMQSFAQEETAQGIMPGTLSSMGNMDAISGMPSDVCCMVHEALWTKEAVRKAGRPGMWVNFAATSMRPAAHLMPFLLGINTKTIAMIPVYFFTEMRTNNEQLILASCALQSGILIFPWYIPTMGALARNPEDCAVSIIAGTLALGTFTKPPHMGVGTFDMESRLNTREVLWTNTVTAISSGRNWGVPWLGPLTEVAGPGTEQILYEAAAGALAFTAAGHEIIWGGPGSRGSVPDHSTGLEGRMIGETANAVAGMKRDKANDILNKLYSLFEDNQDIHKAPKGKSFRECYDVKAVKPTQEYLDIFSKVKTELTTLGINYTY